MKFILYIKFNETGYIKVVSFPTAFDRALQMVLLSSQPVTLRIPEAA